MVAAHNNFDYIDVMPLSYESDDMLRSTSEQAETLTFRIAPELKAAFVKIAEAEAKPLGELLR